MKGCQGRFRWSGKMPDHQEKSISREWRRCENCGAHSYLMKHFNEGYGSTRSHPNQSRTLVEVWSEWFVGTKVVGDDCLEESLLYLPEPYVVIRSHVT